MLLDILGLLLRCLFFCFKLIWCLTRASLVVLNNLYCIPTYVFWLVILSPLNSLNLAIYRNIEGILFHWLLSMVAIWSYSAGYNIIETGDRIDNIVDQETLVIANHQSTSDVPLMMAAFNTRPGLLPQLNWIMDSIFKYTNFGVVSSFHGDFFISAGREKREATVRDLANYLRSTYIPCRRKWLVLFPEGGFLRKRRLISQRYAEKNGLPMLQHVTLPRLGALKAVISELTFRATAVSTMKSCRSVMENLSPKPLLLDDRSDTADIPNNNLKMQSGCLKYVLDLTIAYAKGVPLSLGDVITGYSAPCKIHFHYRLYPAKDVPTDEQKLQTWLYDRYIEKEKMLKSYYETGEWRSFVASGKSEDGDVLGKFVEISVQRQVEQDVLRTILLHTFFLCSTYCHIILCLVVVKYIKLWF